MKKVLSLIMILAIVLCTSTSVYAAGYSFDLQYEGTIIKNVQKNANVLLVGEAAPAYATVLIKVDITGPATPQILATDSAGTEYDIAQLGYWGPPSGFAVGGDFVNTTPIRATFPEEGTYSVTLSLVDVANANAIIEAKSFEIEVFEDLPAVDDTNNVIGNAIISNEIIANNTLEELPKTGTSIAEYMLYTGIIVSVLTISIIFIKRKTINA